MSGIMLMFAIVASLSNLDISTWQLTYFVVNLACAPFISIFAAIYQVASVNLASSLPNRYMEPGIITLFFSFTLPVSLS